ncbi:MAG TPA: hypothetical protein VGF75_01830, partial [Candidatus Saccharimonadales bacterium]
FTKGQSPLQTLRVLSYTWSKLQELLPEAKAVSALVDDVRLPEQTLKRDSIYPPITISADFINSRLGTELSAQQIAGLLTNVECKVELSGDNLTISAPFWRTDIELREDIVEEVGRLYGYENIALLPLEKAVQAVEKNKQLQSNSEIRQVLSAGGANELLNYSFVSKRLIENATQSVDQAFEVTNSISPELQHYRLSLMPSLLAKVNMNIKAGFDRFALYEIGSYHQIDRFSAAEPDLPAEYSSLALVYASKQPTAGAAYFRSKAFLSFLLDELGVGSVSFEPLKAVAKLDDRFSELVKPFDPERSALVKTGDHQWGVVGELKSSVIKNLKLPKYVSGFEIDSNLLAESQRTSAYKKLSKYPPVKQDITLNVPDGSNFADLDSFLTSELKKLVPLASIYTLKPVSIFKPESSSSATNYTFHLMITSQEKTLKAEEVNRLLEELAKLASDKFGASRV